MIHSQVHLRIPCYDFLILQMNWFTCLLLETINFAALSRIEHVHRYIQSIEATGGVYKGQVHNQHTIVHCVY